jgi:ankyrin repeat protein
MLDNNADLKERDGIKLNIQNTRGQTALMIAAENECLEVARLLVEHGADLNMTDDLYKANALFYAYEGYRKSRNMETIK